MTNDKSLAHTLGPILGATYILLGIVGFFVTGFTGFTANTNETLLGLELNVFHNIVHIGAGLFLFIMTRFTPAPAAEGAMMGVGLTLVVLFVIGVTGDGNLSILSVVGMGSAIHFFHLVTGVLVLVIGLLASSQTQAQM